MLTGERAPPLSGPIRLPVEGVPESRDLVITMSPVATYYVCAFVERLDHDEIANVRRGAPFIYYLSLCILDGLRDREDGSALKQQVVDETCRIARAGAQVDLHSYFRLLDSYFGEGFGERVYPYLETALVMRRGRFERRRTPEDLM